MCQGGGIPRGGTSEEKGMGGGGEELWEGVARKLVSDHDVK